MSKKVIVFDLDDTLISEKEYIQSGFKTISEEIEKEFGIDKFIVENKINELFYITASNVFNRLLDVFNIQYDEEYIKKLVHIYRNHEPKIELYEDAKEILEWLLNNGYKIGMITDGYKETQVKKIEALNIEKYFEHIIITDELGREFWKPSEVPYKLIKEKFNCRYDDMMYIGDNVAKDFVTANRLGIETIQIHRENSIYEKKNLEFDDKKKANYSIKNLNEIREKV